jgi:hypothetical protein
MSKRVTTQIDFKDADIAKAALKAASMSFEENGTTLRITSGACRDAVINLRTGEITGDTDYGHGEKAFGLLRQNYAEAKFRAEAFKNGVTINESTTDKEGNVVLMCSLG